jgi:ABC-type amino acid transport substrate-binding protein
MIKALRPLVFCLILPFGTPLPAQESAPATPSPIQAISPSPSEKILKVGVAIEEPFDLKKSGVYQGYCIDLWQALAGDLGLKFRFVEYPSFDELIEATMKGEVDVNANPLYITSKRLQKMEFLMPFIQGGMQIMINENRGTSAIKLWNGLRDSGHLKVFEIGITVILVGTILLTLGDRYLNKEFPSSWIEGLAESFYHVMSICMTGKSSHKPLPGPFGKIMAGVWTAFGVAVVAYITSTITSVMTVNNLHSMINGPQDLTGHKVGVLKGGIAENYCETNHLNHESFSTLPETVQALIRNDIDAIVGDAMSLQWYDNSHPELPITEVGPIFEKKYCAFALPLGSPLRHDLNEALTRRYESGYCEKLRQQYFGNIQ